MTKLLTVAAASLMGVCAFASNVQSVTPVNAVLVDDTYQAAPVYRDDLSEFNLGSDSGWVAGIQLTWNSESQNAKETKASVSDSPAGLNSISEYTVYNGGDKTPKDRGMVNSTKSTGTIFNKKYWMVSTEWYIYVTPEFLYSISGVDYSAELSIGDNKYTITVPHSVELVDDKNVKWYPAVGLLGDKVYGDAQHLADQIALDNYTSVKFLSDPSGLTFPPGFKAGTQGEDGKWGVAMDHQHAWTFAVSVDGATLTARCGNAGCPYETTTVSLLLSGGDKVYDNNAITAAADFGEYFDDIFSDATASISIAKGGEVVETIKDAGEYTVTMTVTGLGDDKTYTLAKTVTISPLDISDATVTFNPASITYDGNEHSVSCSVTKNNLAATYEIGENSVTSAAAIGVYAVNVNGTGNFTGTASATWEIKNTTGEIGGVAAASAGYGSVENNALTVTDTTALEFSDGAWYAGLTLTWPMTALNVSLNPLRDGSAQYVKPESMQMVIDGDVYKGNEIVSGEAVYGAGKIAAQVSTGTYKYYESVFSQPTKEFEYLAATTWKVAITPAIVEAALADSKTELAYTMNAGAFVWEDGREGDSDGVAFTDYTITVPLVEPVVFALGEGETYDLGSMPLVKTRILLAPGACVTSAVEQIEGAIYTEATGYEIERTEVDGKYVYAPKFTHVHDWSFEVVDGTNLVARCENDDCDINGGTVSMWLHVDATEKVFDGQSMTRAARYDDYFKTAFPSASAVVTVNGEDGPIKDVGTYNVVMTVTGLGDDMTYTLPCTVTVSPVDISAATLTLTPASVTYNAAEQTTALSVSVNGLEATLDKNSFSATEIGAYPITVDGTGNFTGTASATWEIKNTTGEPTSVTAMSEGSLTNEGTVFTLADSRKLEYANGVWYAGVTITWPVDAVDASLSPLQNGHAYYVKPDEMQLTVGGSVYAGSDLISAPVEYSDGIVEATTTSGTYRYLSWSGIVPSLDNNSFTRIDTTTWKIRLTPESIEAAIGENKDALTYTMNAGAFVWGGDTEGDLNGVVFRDYTITIPLEGIKLYDENGHQVYPVPSEEDVVQEMIDAIEATELDEGTKTSATNKVVVLVDMVTATEAGGAKTVSGWVDAMVGKAESPASFYESLANSEYVKASYLLGTQSLITDVSEVAIASFESVGGKIEFSVTIDGDDVEAARVKALGLIKTTTDLKTAFATVDAERVNVTETGRIEIAPSAASDSEFFMLQIEKD